MKSNRLKSIGRRCAMVLGVVALSLTTALAGQQEQALASLDWMLGTWSRPAPQGRAIERWSRVDEHLFRGESRTSSTLGAGKLLESLLLMELDGEVFYLAKVPQNAFPVPFRLTSASPTRAVFENPTHDFPTRLEYVLEDDALRVKVSGKGDEGFWLRFTPVAP